MRKRVWLTWLEVALTIGGVACLAFVFWAHHEASKAQRQAKKSLGRKSAAQQSKSTAPNGSERPFQHGDIIGELVIPRLRMSVMVFEGDDESILKLGAGHIPGTALPQGSGNVGIAAHRDTYFRPLRLIRPNGVITFKTESGTSHYTVTQIQIVQPSDIEVLAKAPGPRPDARDLLPILLHT